MVSDKDRTILRAVAEQYREICDCDANQSNIDHWRNLNNLTSKRPLVYCNTGLLGGEIHPYLPACRSGDPELQRVEGWFRWQLWHAGLGDDRVFYPWLQIHAGMFSHSEGVWGITPDQVSDKQSRSWRHMPVLKRLEDLDRLKATDHRVIDADPPLAGRLRDIFGDILPVHVRRSTVYPDWGGTDHSEAAGTLFGIEELLYLLVDAPDMIHRIHSTANSAALRSAPSLASAS